MAIYSFFFQQKLLFLILFIIFNLQWIVSGSFWPVCNQSGVTRIRLQLPYDETNRFLDAPRDSVLAIIESANDRILEPTYRMELEFLDTGGNFSRDVELSASLAFNDNLLFYLFPTNPISFGAFLQTLDFIASQESDPEEAEKIRFGFPVFAPLDPSPGIREPFRRNVINHVAGYVDEIETMVDFATQRLNFSRIGLFDTGYIPLQDILAKALERKNRRLVAYRFNAFGLVTTEELDFFESMNIDTLFVGAVGPGVVPFFLESVRNGGYLNGTDIFLPTLSGTASEVQQSGNQLFNQSGAKQRIFGTAFLTSWSAEDRIQPPFDPNQLMTLNERYNLDLDTYDPTFFDRYPGFIPLPTQVFSAAAVNHVAQILSTIPCEELTREALLQKVYTLSSVRVATDVVYGPYNDICVGPQDPECCNEGVKQLTVAILNTFSNDWDTTFIKQWSTCRSVINDPSQLPNPVLIATAEEREEFVRFVQFGATDSLEDTRVSPFTLNYKLNNGDNGQRQQDPLRMRNFYQEMKEQDGSIVIAASSFHQIEDPTFENSIVAIETDNILFITENHNRNMKQENGDDNNETTGEPMVINRDSTTLINIFPDLSDRLYSVFINEQNSPRALIYVGNVQGKEISVEGVIPIVDLWAREFSISEFEVIRFSPQSLTILSPSSPPSFVVIIDDLNTESSLLLSETLDSQLSDINNEAGATSESSNVRLYLTETFLFEIPIESLQNILPNSILVWFEVVALSNDSSLILDYFEARETFVFQRDQLITKPLENSTKKRYEHYSSDMHKSSSISLSKDISGEDIKKPKNKNNNDNNNGAKYKNAKKNALKRQDSENLYSESASIVPIELSSYITGKFISSVIVGINGPITASSFLNSVYSTGTFSIDQGLIAGPFEGSIQVQIEDENQRESNQKRSYLKNRQSATDNDITITCNKGLRSLALIDISSMSLQQDIPFPITSWETCGAQPRPRENLSDENDDDNDIGLIAGTLAGGITFIFVLIVCCLMVVIITACMIILVLLILLSSSTYIIATREPYQDQQKSLYLPKEPNYYEILFPIRFEEEDQLDMNLTRAMPLIQNKVIKERVNMFRELILKEKFSSAVTKSIILCSESSEFNDLGESMMNIFYYSHMEDFILEKLIDEEIEIYKESIESGGEVIMREVSPLSSMYSRYALMVGLPYIWKALSNPFYDLYRSIVEEKERAKMLLENKNDGSPYDGTNSKSGGETGSSSGYGEGSFEVSMDPRTNSTISGQEDFKRNMIKTAIDLKIKFFTQKIIEKLVTTPFPEQLSNLISKIIQKIRDNQRSIDEEEKEDKDLQRYIRNCIGSCVFYKFIIPVMVKPSIYSLCPGHQEQDFIRTVQLSSSLIGAMVTNTKFDPTHIYYRYNDIIDTNDKQISRWFFNLFLNKNDATEEEIGSEIFENSSSGTPLENMKEKENNKSASNNTDFFVVEVSEQILIADVKKAYRCALENKTVFLESMNKELGRKLYRECEIDFLNRLGFKEDYDLTLNLNSKKDNLKKNKDQSSHGNTTDRGKSNTKGIPRRRDKKGKVYDEYAYDDMDSDSIEIVSDLSSEEPIENIKSNIHGDISDIKTFINSSSDNHNNNKSESEEKSTTSETEEQQDDKDDEEEEEEEEEEESSSES